MLRGQTILELKKMSDVNCIYRVGSVPVCHKEMVFPIGKASEALILNIVGRTERVYRSMEGTDENGLLTFDVEKLPRGFFSIHTPVYRVWFEDLMGNTEWLVIDGKNYKAIEFNFNSSILEGFEQPKVQLWER